jgi:hypothetical protein
MSEVKRDADKRVTLYDRNGKERVFEPIDAKEALAIGFYTKEKPEPEPVKQPAVKPQEVAEPEKVEAKDDKKPKK